MEGRIERLVEADAPAYRNLWLRGLEECPAAFLHALEDGLRMTDEQYARAVTRGVIFGYKEDNVLLGVAVFKPSENNVKLRHRGSVGPIYVAPEARGKSIGRKLMETVLAYAADHVEQVHLGLAENNKAAFALYVSLGFEQYGLMPRSMKLGDAYINEILMVKILR